MPFLKSADQERDGIRGTFDANAGAAFDIVFSDNKKVAAKLVGRDPFTDLAVLQVPPQGLKAAALGRYVDDG